MIRLGVAVGVCLAAIAWALLELFGSMGWNE